MAQLIIPIEDTSVGVKAAQGRNLFRSEVEVKHVDILLDTALVGRFGDHDQTSVQLEERERGN